MSPHQAASISPFAPGAPEQSSESGPSECQWSSAAGGHLIDPLIPVLLNEVGDPAHDRPPWQAAAEEQAAECYEPGHRIHPLLQAEVLDRNRPAADPGDHGADHQTAHSRVERSSVIKDGGEQGAACQAASKP
jgi:hypothetical protein